MAIACCPKEYAEECEILVCVDAPAPHNPGLYQRLRFGLLSSSWLPSPLGIFVWSAFHVMLLIVGGPIFWVLGLLTAFLYSVIVFSWLVVIFCLTFVVGGLFAVASDLVLLLVQSISFCWSFVDFIACHKPIVERRGGECSTVEFWKAFKSGTREMFCIFVSIGVPCMSGSLYKETKDWKLKTWAQWCEEVVHMHDAIALSHVAIVAPNS